MNDEDMKIYEIGCMLVVLMDVMREKMDETNEIEIEK